MLWPRRSRPPVRRSARAPRPRSRPVRRPSDTSVSSQEQQRLPGGPVGKPKSDPRARSTVCDPSGRTPAPGYETTSEAKRELASRATSPIFTPTRRPHEGTSSYEGGPWRSRMRSRVGRYPPPYDRGGTALPAPAADVLLRKLLQRPVRLLRPQVTPNRANPHE